ncbi:prolyl oligopeptidase family serine peptidase [Natronospira bacteriovora]|uniref:Prolyl oligopeptidase family serine peptidase n=1 Tax=Natronospira bacteriovora TaxID=3069753 RepID=A0ABU0W5C6_9GAMM|nr:prolyl oligopeptidase family serine peptidase [Natronospira sp. AB-CW4]MDQ2069167.1 prolyl oligopeptidase family serine peptidase [Natronospira sp. AB-CW4]
MSKRLSLLFFFLTAMILVLPAMADNDDPYLWLEDVEGEQALAWAEKQNERSLAYLEAHPLFDSLHERALQIVTSDDRIAYPSLMGGAIYNFWRDSQHVRGIWRTATLEAYREGDPEWDVILDVDKLAKAEDENWVWAGASCRYPDYDRCIIGLSRGGADAAVRREFDLEKREFVKDGYWLPEAKSRISWRDRDSVFVGTDWGDDSLTTSGYPRQVRIWERGTPVQEAKLVFEGERDDVAVTGVRVWDSETPHDLIVRSPGFFTRHYYLYRDGETHHIPIPDDAALAGIVGGQLLVELKSDWKTGSHQFAQGALISTSMESLNKGKPEFELVYQPTVSQALVGVSTTENRIIVGVLENVIGRLYTFRREEGEWKRERLAVPDMGTINVVSTDDKSDRFFYNYTGFLTPSTLYEADAAADSHQSIRSEPERFSKEGLVVEQLEARSADGTRIPYFIVKPDGLKEGDTRPTLLGAYGGFEVSRTPFYSGIIGSSWLEKGNVYVLANIRGGGEFGPRWHQAALKENRQRAFDDLVAVAEDLVERGITTAEQLGIQGGSNGGLLVGAVFTQRPELFNAVVSQVPLLDMKRYHKLLAGASWMAEYGNPDDPNEWAFIREYSPYHNLHEDADYPKVFFTTSTRDDRVHPAHARKMVARMMEMGHDVLYYENIEGGHGGAANLKQQAYIAALIYSYLHGRLGGENAAP